MASFQGSCTVCGLQYQQEQCLLGSSQQKFSVQDTPPQLELVGFLKELPELRLVGQLVSALAQGPILHLHNHLTQEGSVRWVCCQSLVIIQATYRPSSTGSMTCRSQLYASMGLAGSLRVASFMAHTASAVNQCWVPKALGMHMGQDILDKASALTLAFPAL